MSNPKYMFSKSYLNISDVSAVSAESGQIGGQRDDRQSDVGVTWSQKTNTDSEGPTVEGISTKAQNTNINQQETSSFLT